jgi:DNA (cytosine-5)-methyltransferase 1
MTHGSLFSGIGGFDLASEWMGWDNIFHCEWNEFGQRVLKHHFPKSISYGDITTTDFTIHRGQIDILTGGFPCQPYSQAGKRLGKEDDRHLWPEMLRAIREIQPRWVVGENVLGLVNWNGGLVFDEVQADLENEGYVVQPYVLPACAVNAPHRRDRVWFVAHSMRGGHRGQSEAPRSDNHEERAVCGNDSNSDSIRLEGWNDSNGGKREVPGQYASALHPSIGRTGFQNFPTQSPICGGDDGLPTELDGITFSKWRQESVKAYGNAIVPQVAHQIFKAIEQYECQASPSP